MPHSIKFLLAGLLSIVLASSVLAQDKPDPKPADAPAAAQPGKDEPKKDEPKKDEPKKEEPKKAEPKKEEKPKPAAPSDEYEYFKMTVEGKGDIYLRLNKTRAPISTENFDSYVKEHFYDGTLIHRVVNQPALHCIQGGGFDDKLHEKITHKPIKNESANGLKNKRATISMARRYQPDSGTSQWFINTRDNLFLDDPQDPNDKNSAYAVFGDVIAGMNVVDQCVSVRTITKTGTTTSNQRMPLQDTPAENLVVSSVTKITKEEAEKAAGADKK
jgi:cyclophilin family peptidyl-prolyl cis-trans isomerase